MLNSITSTYHPHLAAARVYLSDSMATSPSEIGMLSRCNAPSSNVTKSSSKGSGNNIEDLLTEKVLKEVTIELFLYHTSYLFNYF